MTNIRRIGYDEADALVPHRIIGAVTCSRIAPREIAVMKEISAVPGVRADAVAAAAAVIEPGPIDRRSAQKLLRRIEIVEELCVSLGGDFPSAIGATFTAR